MKRAGAARMSPPIKILVCDHRGAGLDVELAALGDLNCEFMRSGSLRQSLSLLDSEPPDLVLLDPLTKSGTVELGAIEGARGETVPTPVLVLVDEDYAIAAQRIERTLPSGAWDLLNRSAPPEELALRVRRLLEQREMAREMRDLRHRASHDDRTDLLRPNTFQARLQEHFSAAQRHKHDLALVLIDLDKFGAINKLHDHTVGDLLIERVGDAIRRTLRVEDVAGRLGGDEFAVLLPYTAKISAAQVVNRLRQEIARLTGKVEGAASEIVVSASLGFETFDGNDLDRVETLRRHAELALRKAKLAGGNRGVYFRGTPE